MANEVTFSTTVNDVKEIGTHASVHFSSIESVDLYNAGINDADLVEITYLDKSIIVPVVPDFNYLDMFKAGLATFNFGSKHPILLCNGALFAEHLGLVKRNPDPNGHLWIEEEGIKFPITFTIKLYQKEGYLEEYRTYDLLRTDDRDDYFELDDEQYCNFREVAVGNIKPGILYRGCSPFHTLIKRNEYSDKAIEAHGIKTIICLNESADRVVEQEGAVATFAYAQDVCYLYQPVSFFGKKFSDGVVTAIRYILSHKGPYFIHCLEGKDRTGFIVAIIEALCGASLEEIKADYMLTFKNYFKVSIKSKAYPIIAKRIEKLLCVAFRTESLEGFNLEEGAKKYYLEIGLTPKEIANLEYCLLENRKVY